MWCHRTKTDARDPGREDHRSASRVVVRGWGSGGIVGTGLGRSVRGTDRPGSGAASSLSGDVRPGKIDQLVRPIQRSCVEEHAHCFLAGLRPDGDPPGWRAAELEAEMADGFERVGADPGSRPTLEPIAGDDHPARREEHDGADPAQHPEQDLLEPEIHFGEAFADRVVCSDVRPRGRLAASGLPRFVTDSCGSMRQATDLP
jgi:hypothetical protein